MKMTDGKHHVMERIGSSKYRALAQTRTENWEFQLRVPVQNPNSSPNKTTIIGS